MFIRLRSWWSRLIDDPSDKRIRLREGDVLLASVLGDTVIGYTFDVALSHREFVTRELGTRPDGAWVGTIRKFDGRIVAVNSRTYYENQLPAPAEVFAVIGRTFR
jgi:hypothetical protein